MVRTWARRGGVSRHKVPVGEPAGGSPPKTINDEAQFRIANLIIVSCSSLDHSLMFKKIVSGLVGI